MKVADINVDLLDFCGDDLSVVNAARVSFAKVSDFEYEYGMDGLKNLRLNDKDAKLINYLAKHKHKSPFNHAFMSFRVKAPIFVARQLVKHEYLPWNEVSRRYVNSEPEFYVPEYWRKTADNVKQGSSEEAFGKLEAIGKCLYCGVPLTGKRTKYCCDNHQSYHWQERNKYKVKFSRWKATAKATNIPFDLEEDDLDWPRTCPYLDLELNYDSDDRADNVASLDKIKPELGYVKGNVQIVSQLANKMKSSATSEQLLKFAKNAALMHGGVFMDTSSSYESFLEQAAETYNRLIDQGLCAEQARMFMPQSMMVEWIWSGTLFAFAKMCKLRLDSHTQKETREVAQMVAERSEHLFPVSWKALMEYGE